MKLSCKLLILLALLVTPASFMLPKSSAASNSFLTVSAPVLAPGEFNTVSSFSWVSVLVSVNSSTPDVNALLYYKDFPFNYTQTLPSDLSLYQKASMTPIGRNGTLVTFEVLVPPFPNGTYVGGLAEAIGPNNTVVYSSSNPSGIYTILDISSPITLYLSIVFTDINPRNLNASFAIVENLDSSYSAMNWSPTIFPSYEPFEFPSIDKEESVYNWQNSQTTYWMYPISGLPKLYPFDSYNYTLDLYFSGSFNFSTIHLDSITLSPGIANTSYLVPRNPALGSPQEADLSYWKYSLTGLYLRSDNSSKQSELMITYSIMRSTDPNAQIISLTILMIFLLLGSTVIMLGPEQIQNRLLIYLSIFVFEFTFYVAIGSISPVPLVVDSLTFAQILTFTLIPCTVCLSVASMIETRWMRFQSLIDACAILIATSFLFYFTYFTGLPAFVFNSVSGLYETKTYDLLSIGWDGWYGRLLLAVLLGGIVISGSIRLSRWLRVRVHRIEGY